MNSSNEHKSSKSNKSNKKIQNDEIETEYFKVIEPNVNNDDTIDNSSLRKMRNKIYKNKVVEDKK